MNITIFVPLLFADAEASNPKEAPSCLVWTYYYLSQHFDFKRDIERALYYIDKALEHTPTLIELFVFKAKIFKVSIFNPHTTGGGYRDPSCFFFISAKSSYLPYQIEDSTRNLRYPLKQFYTPCTNTKFVTTIV